MNENNENEFNNRLTAEEALTADDFHTCNGCGGHFWYTRDGLCEECRAPDEELAGDEEEE